MNNLEKRNILLNYYTHYGTLANLKTMGKEDKELGLLVDTYRGKLEKLGYDKEKLYSMIYILEEMKDLRLKIEGIKEDFNNEKNYSHSKKEYVS